MPLDPAACDWIVRAVEWSRRQPRQAKRLALVARESRREHEFDRSVDEVLNEM
jgi:hypothetical protein